MCTDWPALTVMVGLLKENSVMRSVTACCAYTVPHAATSTPVAAAAAHHFARRGSETTRMLLSKRSRGHTGAQDERVPTGPRDLADVLEAQSSVLTRTERDRIQSAPSPTASSIPRGKRSGALGAVRLAPGLVLRPG